MSVLRVGNAGGGIQSPYDAGLAGNPGDHLAAGASGDVRINPGNSIGIGRYFGLNNDAFEGTPLEDMFRDFNFRGMPPSGNPGIPTPSPRGGIGSGVVIDSTGVEGRRTNGFTANSNIPVFQSVFPLAGAAAGGTELTLRGLNFIDGPGFQVRIDGIPQTNVTVNDSTDVTVVTNAGVAGGPYTIDVVNPTGELATLAYTYVAPADPLITTVVPATETSRR